MKTKYLLLIIVIFLVGCSTPTTAPTQIPPMATPTLVPSMATATDVPTTSTVPIAGVQGIETSGGFLWAWNGDEIWRYSGGEWSPYAASPYYEDPFLQNVAFVSDRLWAVVDNRLQYLVGGEWQEIPGQDQDVYRVRVDDQIGFLWVSAGETVYHWNGEEMTDVGPQPISRGFVWEMAVTGDRDLWAGFWEDQDSPNLGELIHYDDAKGAWEIVRPWRSDEGSKPLVLAPTPNGDLWVLLMTDFQRTEKPWVLAHRDGASGEWTAFEKGFPQGLPWAMAADDEAVWLAQGKGYVLHGGFDGLVRFDGENWSRYLRGTEVDEVAVAPDGTIWYLTSDETLRQLQ